MGSELFRRFENNDVINKDVSLDTLYEYQKQYMKLVREYKNEIEFINNQLKELREEQEKFYSTDILKISDVLDNDKVDEEAKKMWLRELQASMSRSFKMSERLLNDFAVKSIDEFRTNADKIIRGL